MYTGARHSISKRLLLSQKQKAWEYVIIHVSKIFFGTFLFNTMKKQYLLTIATIVFIAAGCNSVSQSVPLPSPAIEDNGAKPVDRAPAPVKPSPAPRPPDAEPKKTISIQTQSSLRGATGQEFVAIFTAVGGAEPYVWRIAKGALPSGLSIEPILVVPDCAPPAPPEKPNCRAPYNDPQSIKITGTLTKAGSFPITLSATDSSGVVGTASVTLVIK